MAKGKFVWNVGARLIKEMVFGRKDFSKVGLL